MIKSYFLDLELITKGMIIPAYQQILLEHRITKDFLFKLCSESHIIPKERIHLWADGIYFGFESNFIVSTHLLIPQVEHLIRIKMKEMNLKTSTLDKDGIETENGLSTLLSHKKITDIMDKNLLFELKALLTEPTGLNLRNNTAHGLSETNSLESIYTVYLWWLCLKLVINSSDYNNQE